MALPVELPGVEHEAKPHVPTQAREQNAQKLKIAGCAGCAHKRATVAVDK
jgi:hypothetical protein